MTTPGRLRPAASPDRTAPPQARAAAAQVRQVQAAAQVHLLLVMGLHLLAMLFLKGFEFGLQLGEFTVSAKLGHHLGHRRSSGNAQRYQEHGKRHYCVRLLDLLSLF